MVFFFLGDQPIVAHAIFLLLFFSVLAATTKTPLQTVECAWRSVERENCDQNEKKEEKSASSSYFYRIPPRLVEKIKVKNISSRGNRWVKFEGNRMPKFTDRMIASSRGWTLDRRGRQGRIVMVSSVGIEGWGYIFPLPTANKEKLLLTNSFVCGFAFFHRIFLSIFMWNLPGWSLLFLTMTLPKVGPNGRPCWDYRKSSIWEQFWENGSEAEDSQRLRWSFFFLKFHRKKHKIMAIWWWVDHFQIWYGGNMCVGRLSNRFLFHSGKVSSQAKLFVWNVI